VGRVTIEEGKMVQRKGSGGQVNPHEKRMGGSGMRPGVLGVPRGIQGIVVARTGAHKNLGKHVRAIGTQTVREGGVAN